ncbi:HK97 family phage prohead protease [Clostridium sp.]|uniref:HK97 family phage prohead protease n=1 Tax=Clostridium sp. TaxID=1506 RepID=UPI002FC5EFC8
MEFRLKSIDIQTDAEDMVLRGYINVTERESEVMYNKKRNKWFKELMEQNVFKRSLNANPSIPLLLEHDFKQQLAHTDDGTLILEEDQIGLKFTAKVEDRNLYEKVKGGLINNCSFGFRVIDESFEPINSKLERRRVSKIELIECSLVSNPAYLGSIVETRELEDALKEEETMKKIEDTKVEETLEDNIEEVIEKEETQEVIVEENVENSTETEIEKNTHKKIEDGEPNLEDTTETETINQENKVETSTENRMVVEEEVDHNQEVETKSLEVMIEEPSINVVVNEEPKVLVKESVADEVSKVIEENIEQKERQLEMAEGEEQCLQAHIDCIKQENESYEEYLEGESNRISTEVIRLRLELLKLKSLKKEL